MALQLHAACSFRTGRCHSHYHLLLPSPIQTPKSKSLVKCQNSQIEDDPTEDPPSGQRPSSAGLGFGSPASTSTPRKAGSSRKNQKGRTDRASVVRRAPVERPAFVSSEEAAKAEEQRKNESAFLLAWLGLGAIILVQGILLAASGFLPEELDNFFVKYLYPAFTPTVGLFVAGTVGYGVLKYIQNEELKSQK